MSVCLSFLPNTGVSHTPVSWVSLCWAGFPLGKISGAIVFVPVASSQVLCVAPVLPVALGECPIGQIATEMYRFNVQVLLF